VNEDMSIGVVDLRPNEYTRTGVMDLRPNEYVSISE
jgi:hypothetical protein